MAGCGGGMKCPGGCGMKCPGACGMKCLGACGMKCPGACGMGLPSNNTVLSEEASLTNALLVKVGGILKGLVPRIPRFS